VYFMPFPYSARRRRRALALAASALLCAPCNPAAAAPEDRAALLLLNRLDVALATVVDRLARANAPLCDEQMPQTGIVLHALGQYASGVRDEAKAVFGFTRPLAVEAVLPGSPGDAAGIRPGDAVLAIEGRSFAQAQPPDRPSSALRDTAEAALTAGPPDRPIHLRLVRDGKPVDVAVMPQSACRIRFEVATDTGTLAQSDGKIIQVSADFVARYSRDALAVVAAHELAHAVLRHRLRLEAAGVAKGLLAQFGRNGRLNRQAEDEADRLSVSLLRNAGYDPEIAVRFWETDGRKLSGGIFRGRTHAGPRTRAATMRRAIAGIPADAPAVYRPPVWATRFAPMR
jgi:hypothetical protein